MPLGAFRLNSLSRYIAAAAAGRTPVTVTANGDAQVDTAQSKFGGASVFLDGTSDYLTVGNELGITRSDDFTYEGWIRFNTLPSNVYYMFGGANDRLHLYLGLRDRGSGTWSLNSSVDDGSNAYYLNYFTPSSVVTGVWYHFAMVKEGAEIRLYWNGTLLTSVQAEVGTMTSGHGWQNLDRVGNWTSGTDYTVDGWMDEIRFSNTARYTTSFTLESTAFTNDANTLLLLHCDGTDGSTTILDDVGVRSPVGVSAVGNAQVDTAQSKFGGASAVFDGTGDALDCNQPLIPASTDWTMEGWFYPTSIGQLDYIFSQYTGAPAGRMSAFINADGTIGLFINGLTGPNNSTTTLSANNWYHIAYVRNGDNFYGFINGTLEFTRNDTSVTVAQTPDFVVGAQDNIGTSGFVGNIDEVRISDIARYTTAFTPSTESFTNDANTLLLLHMDGTDGSTDFIDDNS